MTRGSPSLGSVLLIGVGILFSIAVGIIVLIPVRMCPALEDAWTESIVSMQTEPKLDQEILSHLRTNHRECGTCRGANQVPLIKVLLYRPDPPKDPRWVMVASYGYASLEQAEATSDDVHAVLSEVGIPTRIMGSKSHGVSVPERDAEKAIRLLRSDPRTRKHGNLDVLQVLRKGPGR